MIKLEKRDRTWSIIVLELGLKMLQNSSESIWNLKIFWGRTPRPTNHFQPPPPNQNSLIHLCNGLQDEIIIWTDILSILTNIRIIKTKIEISITSLVYQGGGLKRPPGPTAFLCLPSSKILATALLCSTDLCCVQSVNKRKTYDASTFTAILSP